MARSRILLGATAAVTAAAVALLGGVLRETAPVAGSARAPAVVAPELALSGFSLGDTAATVRRLAEQAREGGDQRSLALLGLAYLQRARETADPSFYSRAETALGRARSLDDADPVALSGLASLAASRHDFRLSLRLARRVISIAPDTAHGYGLLGDALLELGRYDEAFRAFDRQVELKPSLGGYARIAYARELLGRPREAIAAMELALEAAGGLREPTAWTLVELGKLRLGLGEFAEAGRSFRLALAAFPGYPTALDGLARVEATREHLPQALALQRRAVAARPDAHLVGQLGDLLDRLGRTTEAEQAWKRAGELEALFAAHGGRNVLETAEFDLNHDRDLRDALARARQGRAERPSIEGDHVLAWALYKNGHCAEARAVSRRSFRLGTLDVDGLYHHSLIESCLGNREAARAYRLRVQRLDPFYLESPPSAKRLRA